MKLFLKLLLLPLKLAFYVFVCVISIPVCIINCAYNWLGMTVCGCLALIWELFE